MSQSNTCWFLCGSLSLVGVVVVLFFGQNWTAIKLVFIQISSLCTTCLRRPAAQFVPPRRQDHTILTNVRFFVLEEIFQRNHSKFKSCLFHQFMANFYLLNNLLVENFTGKFHRAQTLKLGGTYRRDAGWFAFSRTLKTAHKSGFHMNFPSSFLDILQLKPAPPILKKASKPLFGDDTNGSEINIITGFQIIVGRSLQYRVLW